MGEMASERRSIAGGDPWSRAPLSALLHPWAGPLLAALAWVLIVVFCEPYGRLWGTGQDAYCYWFPTLAAPYAHSDWTDPVAYVYSPAFLQVLTPIRALPFQAYIAAWTLIQFAALLVVTGRRWFAVGLLLASMEIAGGNIHLLLAAAMVIGFRYPAAWSLVLLTKVTPGVGLLWFLVRREWRQLAIALGGTLAVAAVSYVLMPDAWAQWVGVLSHVAGRDGTWAAVPVPFLVRAPIAAAVVIWGARTDRFWTVPVAGMLALPALWYGGLSMLLAVIVLRDPSRLPTFLRPVSTPKATAATGLDPDPSSDQALRRPPD